MSFYPDLNILKQIIMYAVNSRYDSQLCSVFVLQRVCWYVK